MSTNDQELAAAVHAAVAALNTAIAACADADLQVEMDDSFTTQRMGQQVEVRHYEAKVLKVL